MLAEPTEGGVRMLYVSGKFSRSDAATVAVALVGATPRTFMGRESCCTLGGAGATEIVIGEDVVALCPSLTTAVALYVPWSW
jgi:hypothetical protein